MASVIQNILSTVTGSVSTLPKVAMGRGGPQVTQIGIGLMGLSAFYGKPKPDEERMKFLDTLYELGELNWDSADMYGDNEDLLGRWFKQHPERRQHIFLATKFANRVDEKGNRSINSTPEYARQACEKSLKRLGLPFVDLYYVHRLDGKTPVEKTIQELAKLKDEGKIKHIGVSECSADSLRRAHSVHPISAVQVEYSPWALDIETEQINVLKVARELGITIVAYSPIGRGMMSGKLRSPDDFEEGDFRRFAPRFSKDNFAKNLTLVDKIGEIAKKKGCTGTQLTLAWLISQGNDIVPIPGTTNIERLKENLGAFDVKLTEEEKQQIRDVSEQAEISGGRYPEAFASALYSDTPPLST